MTDDKRGPRSRLIEARITARAAPPRSASVSKPVQEPGGSALHRGGASKASGVSDSSAPVHVRFDAFELDEINARLLRDGQPLPVAPTPFALLCALVRQSGSLITKGALLDAVWGHRYVSESVLKTAISELRTALGDDARRPRYIETVSRRGYRFIGRANATPHAQPAAAQDIDDRRPWPHRSRRCAVAPAERVGACVSRQADHLVGRRGSGRRQDHAGRSLRRTSARRQHRSWPMRRAVR